MTVNLENQLLEIDPTPLNQWLLKEKVTLVDVREPAEYAREHIQPVPFDCLFLN